MEKKNVRIFLSFLLVSLLLLVGCSTNQNIYSGTIEGEEIPVLAELGGQIKTLSVDEGTSVKKDQTLATIDDRILKAQLKEAEAGVAAAKASLDEAKAGARDQEIKQTLANLEQIDSEMEQLKIQTKKADDLLKINESQIQQTSHSLAAAQKTLAYQKEQLQKKTSLFQQGAISEDQLKAQQEIVNQAEAKVNTLNDQLISIKAQYLAEQKDKEALQVQLQAVEAKKKIAEAKLSLQQEGASSYTVSRLYQLWQQAIAKKEQVLIQLEKATINSPIDGIVLRKNVSQREILKPNSQIFTLLNPKKLNIKVYVPETNLNQVKIGQKVAIKVDAFPDQSYEGKIVHISDKAEFTPKNVQTPDERTKMVFAVTIETTNGFDQLKPGMPADITFQSEEDL
ncbi:HlyD family secretion protein [Tepidibacillus sp. HK-1]|uniref:HlyD family secretion protein n=1 Tax=Tepidibacillus sp. HK-1 TaxID=1883407 RepID=UPI000852D5FC|nr:HlyD family efflux transporter periplasmic adaptor subunit [Tepidibacillus sp. HK-1]GBF10700.1 putative efflux pump membrane fusion protein [Tepidibacillus sp. HK-1]